MGPRHILVLLSVASFVACTSPPEESVGASEAELTGAHDATKVYPFMVSLQDANGNHGCGGTLIAPEWVLTAEHCVNRASADILRVRVGSLDTTTGGATARVAAIVHPPPVGGWSVPEIALFPSHDIALLRLAAPVPSTPVKLAQSAGRPGSPIRLLGWGHTCVGRPFNVGCTIPVKLQELDTVLSESAVCASVFANPVNELCVGAYGAPGACNGDSGGPAIVNVGGAWRLAGVTSRAAAPYYMCGANPAVYTNATEWRAWINGVTGLAL